jgi:hypothetical protein
LLVYVQSNPRGTPPPPVFAQSLVNIGFRLVLRGKFLRGHQSGAECYALSDGLVCQVAPLCRVSPGAIVDKSKYID